jgi:hypothetical protein
LRVVAPFCSLWDTHDWIRTKTAGDPQYIITYVTEQVRSVWPGHRVVLRHDPPRGLQNHAPRRASHDQHPGRARLHPACPRGVGVPSALALCATSSLFSVSFFCVVCPEPLGKRSVFRAEKLSRKQLSACSHLEKHVEQRSLGRTPGGACGRRRRLGGETPAVGAGAAPRRGACHRRVGAAQVAARPERAGHAYHWDVSRLEGLHRDVIRRLWPCQASQSSRGSAAEAGAERSGCRAAGPGHRPLPVRGCRW